MAILAPAESANHSSGTLEALGEVERGDDPPALGLGQRAERARRVAEQRSRAASPRGSARCGCGRAPTTMLARVRGRRAVDRRRSSPVVRRGRARRTRRPGSPRRGRARSGASSLTISAGWTMPRRRAETIRWAPSSSGCSGSRRRIVDLHDHAAAGGVEEAQHAVALGAVRAVAHAAAQLRDLEAEADASRRAKRRDDLAAPPRARTPSSARRRATRGSTAAGRAAAGATGTRASRRTPGRPSARAPGRR